MQDYNILTSVIFFCIGIQYWRFIAKSCSITNVKFYINCLHSQLVLKILIFSLFKIQSMFSKCLYLPKENTFRSQNYKKSNYIRSGNNKFRCLKDCGFKRTKILECARLLTCAIGLLYQSDVEITVRPILPVSKWI